MATDRVFFHEDEHGQIELLPGAAWEFCRGELETISRLAAEDRSQDGLGWADTHTRRESPLRLDSVKLAVEILEAAVDPALERVARVTTGILTHDSVVPDARGFTLGENCTLFASVPDGQQVDALWLRLKNLDALQAKAMGATFAALAAHDLLLVDWGRSVLTKLGDASALAEYLGRRTRRLSPPA